MVTKKFLLVCKSRESNTCYVSGSVFDLNEVSHHVSFLDSIGVDVVDVLCVGVDLSQYAH